MDKYFLIDTAPSQSLQEQNEALKHVAFEVAETSNRLRCDAIRIIEGCALIRKGRKCGIINKEGRVIVPIEMQRTVKDGGELLMKMAKSVYHMAHIITCGDLTMTFVWLITVLTKKALLIELL